MLLKKLLVAVTVATLACVTSAQAAPIMFQEAVSGDLPAEGLLPTFTLDLGVNTVSGTVAYTMFGPGVPRTVVDFDGFAFIVPAGTQVTNVSVVMTDSIDTKMSVGIWTLYRGSNIAYTPGLFGELLTCTFPFPSPTGPSSCSAQLSSGPLRAQVYNFNSWAVMPRGNSATSDYTFSLTLSPIATVPEPGSLALAGTVVTGLLARRRRA
jgi:hypothetical protein